MSTLLTLPFGDDAYDDDLDAAVARLEAAFDGWTYDRHSLEAAALATNVLSVWTLKQLAANVPAEVLKVIGEKIWGVPPVAAAAASVASTWTFPDTAGHIIEAGTEVELVDGDRSARFTVAADVTITAGSSATAVGEVVLQAVDAGETGNDFPAQTANLVDALAGPPVVETIAATDGGVDAEDDDTYQARLVEELRVPGAPILEDDFAVRARSVAGVHRAVAVKGYNPADSTYDNEGMVTVAVVAEDGTAVAPSVLSDVEDLLEDDDRRIVNVDVHVVDPDFTAVNVVFVGVSKAGYDAATVEAAAEAAVADFLDPAVWGAVDGDTDWSNRTVVRHQDVSAVLNAVDGFDHWTTLELNGGTADVTLAGPAPLPDPTSTVSGTVT